MMPSSGTFKDEVAVGFTPRDDGEDSKPAVPLRAPEDVNVERPSEQVRPAHPRDGGVERTTEKSIPVADGEMFGTSAITSPGRTTTSGRGLHRRGAAANRLRRPRLHRPLEGR